MQELSAEERARLSPHHRRIDRARAGRARRTAAQGARDARTAGRDRSAARSFRHRSQLRTRIASDAAAHRHARQRAGALAGESYRRPPGDNFTAWRPNWFASARPAIACSPRRSPKSRDERADWRGIGGKGIFIKELEDALLAGTIDLAVHSMKDVPTEIPEGLGVSRDYAARRSARCLISRSGPQLERLPPGARVGTSSLRRQAQLRHTGRIWKWSTCAGTWTRG